ncbi:MAG: class I SAM-dependent methyltransferase [bacterium]|nr:class I SAM-dependent methyltransferase [bacterium]
MTFRRHKYTYEGKDALPNQTWHKYFEDSIVGKQYEVLYQMDGDEIGKLVMSDTEYELKTNTPFFEEIQKRGSGCKVLSLGYGIGFVNEVMKSLKADFTVIEKYQEVIDLAPSVPKHVRLVMGDINTMDLRRELGQRKFDIIFCDVTDSDQFIREKDLMEFLDKGGRIMHWTHM